MAQITTPSNTLTSPVWAAQVRDTHTLVPGGATLAAGDFTADSDGKKKVQAGTLLGRTRTERDAGTGLGPWTTGDEEVFLAAFDVYDIAADPGVTLYRPSSMVYENWLPGWSGYSSGKKAAVRGAYQCILGGEVS